MAGQTELILRMSLRSILFYYLGDTTCAGGGMEASSIAMTGLKKFRELLPLLILREFSLSDKEKIVCENRYAVW